MLQLFLFLLFFLQLIDFLLLLLFFLHTTQQRCKLFLYSCQNKGLLLLLLLLRLLLLRLLKVHCKATQSKLWNREEHDNRKFRRRFLANTTDLQVNQWMKQEMLERKSLACKFIHNVRSGLSRFSHTRGSGVYVSLVTIVP